MGLLGPREVEKKRGHLPKGRAALHCTAYETIKSSGRGGNYPRAACCWVPGWLGRGGGIVGKLRCSAQHAKYYGSNADGLAAWERSGGKQW